MRNIDNPNSPSYQFDSRIVTLVEINASIEIFGIERRIFEETNIGSLENEESGLPLVAALRPFCLIDQLIHPADI